MLRVLILGIGLIGVLINAQSIKVLNQEQDSVSFRGLSVVDENTFWVAGSKGVIGKTENGGQSFKWFIEEDYIENEFRDIEAFSNKHAYVMAITQPASILELKKSGKDFRVKYKDSDKKAFLDALSCLSEDQCIAVGDAVQAHEFYLLKKDKNKWLKIKNTFNTQEGEAFFAASGTNIQKINENEFIAVSGGKVSRLLYHYQGVEKVQELDMIQGQETTGANGFYFNPATQKGIVVGGDFMNKENSMFNLLMIKWNPESQTFEYQLPEMPPKGYKSSVCQLTDLIWICCGTSGVDISQDGGKIWHHFSDESYHVIKTRNEYSAILAGPNGKIALLQL